MINQRFKKITVRHSALTLVEVLVTLVIGSLLLIAVIGIFNRVQRSAAAMERKFVTDQLHSEILQLIAEDLDTIIDSGQDVSVRVENKSINGYPTAKLQITRTIKDVNSENEVFEQITWQAGYDWQSDANGLVLYRSYSGLCPEDNLLQQDIDRSQRELFIPVCSGLTMFSVEIPRAGGFLDSWTEEKLPPGLQVSISFAPPQETSTGEMEFFEENIISRNIVIDRTRFVNFSLTKRGETEYPWLEDVNQADVNDANEGMLEEDVGPEQVLGPVNPVTNRRGR